MTVFRGSLPDAKRRGWKPNDIRVELDGIDVIVSQRGFPDEGVDLLLITEPEQLDDLIAHLQILRLELSDRLEMTAAAVT